MDNKNFLANSVTIKTEPNTPPAKKVLLSNSPFAQLAAKSVSSTRLASFKPPRDLLLTGSTTGNSNSSFNINSGAKSTRRTFVPNINVTRRKGCSDAQEKDSSDSNQKSKERNKRPQTNKKRSLNVVQTKGVFSEGLAPGKVKAFGSASGERSYNERQILEKPKLNLDRKICKSDEDKKLKSILKDDFIDDPSQVPDINFIPNCLPMVYNIKKSNPSRDLERTFESLQVKAEKVSKVNINELKSEKPDVTSIMESNQNPKLFLFEFPNLVQQKDDVLEKKKVSKGQPNENVKQSAEPEGLSSLGEGFLGYLRIYKNGKACLVTGKSSIPLCVTRHSTRQEIMSTSIDAERSKGEVISLGTVDASFTCSANFFHDVS